MIRQQDEAYVLGTLELGEADRIVTLFARQQGKVRAVARSARRSRRRFGGILEPLTRVRITWTEKTGRDLHRLDSAEGVRSFAAMQADPLIQAACAVVAEILTSYSHEGQDDEPMFRLVGAVLEAMERGGDPRRLLRYFEFWILALHGLLPDLTRCACCGEPLASEPPPRASGTEGLLCASCPGRPGDPRFPLSAEDRRVLAQIRRTPPGSLPADPPGRRGRGLELLLRGALETFAERSFRSYRHFRAAESAASGGGPS